MNYDRWKNHPSKWIHLSIYLSIWHCIDALGPCFNIFIYILYIKIMSYKEAAGHLHAVATEKPVKIGPSLRTLIRVQDVHVSLGT